MYMADGAPPPCIEAERPYGLTGLYVAIRQIRTTNKTKVPKNPTQITRMHATHTSTLSWSVGGTSLFATSVT